VYNHSDAKAGICLGLSGPQTEVEDDAGEGALYVKMPGADGKTVNDVIVGDTINKLGEQAWEVVGYPFADDERRKVRSQASQVGEARCNV
jgi:hypothetical protein